MSILQPNSLHVLASERTRVFFTVDCGSKELVLVDFLIEYLIFWLTERDAFFLFSLFSFFTSHTHTHTHTHTHNSVRRDCVSGSQQDGKKMLERRNPGIPYSCTIIILSETDHRNDRIPATPPRVCTLSSFESIKTYHCNAKGCEENFPVRVAKAAQVTPQIRNRNSFSYIR